MAKRKRGSNYLTVCWFLCVFFSTLRPSRKSPSQPPVLGATRPFSFITLYLFIVVAVTVVVIVLCVCAKLYTLRKHYQMYICSSAKQFSFRRLICIYMPLTWYLFFAFHNGTFVCMYSRCRYKAYIKKDRGLWDAASEQVCVFGTDSMYTHQFGADIVFWFLTWYFNGHVV